MYLLTRRDVASGIEGGTSSVNLTEWEFLLIKYKFMFNVTSSTDIINCTVT